MRYIMFKVGDIILTRYAPSVCSDLRDFEKTKSKWTIVRLQPKKTDYDFTIEMFNEPNKHHIDDQRDRLRISHKSLHHGVRIEHLKEISLYDPDFWASLKACEVLYKKEEFKNFLKGLILKEFGPYPVPPPIEPIKVANTAINLTNMNFIENDVMEKSTTDLLQPMKPQIREVEIPLRSWVVINNSIDSPI